MMEPMQIADAIEKLIESSSKGSRIRSAIVTAVSAGMTEIRRAGSTASEGGYARLIPGAPKVGQRVAIAKMGGAEIVLGVLSRVAETLIDLGAAIVGQLYSTSKSQITCDTASTTSISPTFADAISLAWSSSDIPDGTYDISVTFSFLAAHSAGSGVAIRSVAGASNGGNHAIPSVDTGTTGTLRIEVQNNYSAVVVAGGITIKGQYAVTSSGTAYGRNPSLRCIATRKA